MSIVHVQASPIVFPSVHLPRFWIVISSDRICQTFFTATPSLLKLFLIFSIFCSIHTALEDVVLLYGTKLAVQHCRPLSTLINMNITEICSVYTWSVIRDNCKYVICATSFMSDDVEWSIGLCGILMNMSTHLWTLYALLSKIVDEKTSTHTNDVSTLCHSVLRLQLLAELSHKIHITHF